MLMIAWVRISALLGAGDWGSNFIADYGFKNEKRLDKAGIESKISQPISDFANLDIPINVYSLIK